MKVLFVGEGAHDIGRETAHNDSTVRAGVVQTLARRVSPQIAPDSPAIRWTELHRFHPDGNRRGLAAKMRAAALIASRREGCAGLVCVVDRDRDDTRATQLDEGAAALENDALPVAWGVAVESIEAWTLGVPDAIATVLNVAPARVRAALPSGSVEALAETSGREERRPKAVLAHVAALGHREPDLAFRVEVAEHTDVDQLARACPDGFAPFVTRLRAAFPPP